jgi:hypothetical protein
MASQSQAEKGETLTNTVIPSLHGDDKETDALGIFIKRPVMAWVHPGGLS